MVENVITPVRLPVQTGFLGFIRTYRKNPMEAWPETLFEEGFHTFKIFGKRIVFVSDPETVKEILNTRRDVFPKSKLNRRMLTAVTGEGLLSVEGERWRQQRAAAAPAFRERHLRNLVPLMTTAGEKATDDMLASPGETDISTAMYDAALTVISDTLFATQTTTVERKTLLRDIEIMFEEMGSIELSDLINWPSFIPRPWRKHGQSAAQRLAARALETVEKLSPETAQGHNLLTYLFHSRTSEKGLPLTDREIADNIVTFVAAGHETTALSLAWTLYLLAANPEDQKRARHEIDEATEGGSLDFEALERMDFLKAVIQESLRLFPSVPVMSRNAIETVRLTNFAFQKNDFVVLGVFPMHRSATIWSDPDAFVPERFLDTKPDRHRYSYIPFSAGGRICIGNRFANLEMLAILAPMLRKLSFALPDGPKPELTQKITLRPKTPIRLSVSPN